MHQALTIQEILRLVFSFLLPECNVCNARVCRQWYNPALDAVWETGGLEMFQSLSSSQLTRSDAHDVPQIVSSTSHSTSIIVSIHAHPNLF